MFDDDLIRNLVDYKNYWKSNEGLEHLRQNAIKMAHKYHYENNLFYNKLCKAKGISKDITTKEFPKIIYPHTVFKSYSIEEPEKSPEIFVKWLRNISTINFNFEIRKTTSLLDLLNQFYENNILLGFSKGTSGKISIIPKDRFTQIMTIKSYVETLDTVLGHNKWTTYRLFGMAHHMFLQIAWNFTQSFEGMKKSDIVLYHNTEKYNSFQNILKKQKSIYDKLTYNFLNLENINIQRLAKRMIYELKKIDNEKIILIGSPLLLREIASNIIENNIKLKHSKDSIIIGVNGLRKIINPENKVRPLINEAFKNIPYLETYTMAEFNSLIIDCKDKKHMHIPPWIIPILFDENNEPLEPEGKVTGLFGFLEPITKSYPGFILTDDYLTIDFDAIRECEVHTPIVTKVHGKTYKEIECSGLLGTLRRLRK